MTVTYRTGYGTTRRTLDQLLTWNRFSNIHPEMQRRLIALMDAARAAGVDLGIGGGSRTTADQFAVFDARHNVVPSGGCCSYDAKSWQVVPGAAHAAPPGLSYHEPTVPLGGLLWAVAVDVVGWENGWVNAPGRLGKYGLRSFDDRSGAQREPWHLQPLELPSGRSLFDPTMHTLKRWDLPRPPAPPVTVPDPTIRLGSTGTEVTELQQEMTFWRWYSATIDGSCGPKTVEAVKRLQTAVKVGADGVYGPVTADAYRKWKQAVSNL